MGFAWTGDKVAARAEHLIDFGRLARAVRDRRSLESLETLWREVFALESWFFIARGTDPNDASNVLPHVIERDGRSCVLLFTDEFGALQHQARHGPHFAPGDHDAGAIGRRPSSGYATLEVRVDAALDVLRHLHRAGANSAIFNFGPAAFESPIDRLIEAHRHVLEGDAADALEATTILPCPPGFVDLDELLARADADPSAHEAALAALLGLEAWWFICNPKEPDAVFIRRMEDGPVVLAFTDERRAIAATDRFGLVGRDGAILLLEMPVGEAIQWTQRFLEHGAKRIVFNDLTTPVQVAITDLPAAWERVADHG
ncbi:MAG: hypothetical protein U0575_09860 [Phycisphaerales bacterium]